jgi:hypothetical protein
MIYSLISWSRCQQARDFLMPTSVKESLAPRNIMNMYIYLFLIVTNNLFFTLIFSIVLALSSQFTKTKMKKRIVRSDLFMVHAVLLMHLRHSGMLARFAYPSYGCLFAYLMSHHRTLYRDQNSRWHDYFE